MSTLGSVSLDDSPIELRDASFMMIEKNSQCKDQVG